MAFPWVFSANFEAGTSGFDTETDDDSILSIAHYSRLAIDGVRSLAPYSGAYCARIRANGGTNPAYFEEADINISANTTNHFRFDILFGADFTGTANDTFNIFECLGSGTVEAAFGGRIVAATNAINLGIGELAPTSFTGTIERNKWYVVELVVDVDNAGADDGTIDMYISEADKTTATAVAVTQVTGLDQAAITDGRLGLQNHLATTTGTILIDNFIQDDARVYPAPRFPFTQNIWANTHIFVGPGTVQSVGLLTQGGSDIVHLWDTDRADVDWTEGYVVEVDDALPESQKEGPWHFEKGCYAVISGTNSLAQVVLNRHIPGKLAGRPVMSTAQYRDLGRSVALV